MSSTIQVSSDIANFLKGFSELQASMAHLSIPEQRSKIREMFVPPKDQLEPVHRVEDRTIQGKNGEIPLRIIHPTSEGNKPVIVFFHRGGWVFGSIDESEGVCRRIANCTQCTVVIVGFRLSPESQFPVPLEDCYDALKWTSKNAKTINSDPQKIILMGESAGGNLAAATSLMARKQGELTIAAQVLIYPILTSELKQERYEASPDKSLLSYENMQWFWGNYLPTPEAGTDELASPLGATSFEKLPKTLVQTADYDALCTEGKEYAEKLSDAGVETTFINYPEVIHGFLDIPVPSPQIKKALNDIKAFVKSLD